MTQDLDATVYGGFSRYALVANSPSGVHQGFDAQYSVYQQIFKMAYQTTNSWIRVWEIDWDAAEKLIGI